MTEKKHEAAESKPPAPAAQEPKESKPVLAQRLLASYLHNMEHGAPRTLEELDIIRALAS